MKLVVFSSRTCTPCLWYNRILYPLIEDGNNIDIKILSNEGVYEQAVELGVTSVPTTIFYKDDVELMRYSGIISKQKLTDLIQELSQDDNTRPQPDRPGNTGSTE